MQKKSQLLKVKASELAALLAVSGIGRGSVKLILSYLKKHEVCFGEFWGNPGKYTRILPLSNRQIDSMKRFKKEHSIDSYLESLDEAGIYLVPYDNGSYPQLLLQAADYPLLLYAKGNMKLLEDERMVAVVGTRKITSYGRLATKKIVGELCSMKAIISSGFMYGVDAAAHQEAMECGGSTVGVLGYGFDHLFPRSQR